MTQPAIQFHVRPGDSLPENVGTIANKARELFAWAQQFDPVFKAAGLRKISVLGVDVVLDNNALAPRIIIGGTSAAKGGGVTSNGVYAPAIAYLPASAYIGDTFRLINSDAALVLHNDPRALGLATQYFRYDKSYADAVLIPDLRLVEYKGRGFAISGSDTHYLAAVLGDLTNGTTLTTETSGALYVASVIPATPFPTVIRKATLPPAPGWRRMGSSGYPTVTLGPPLLSVPDSLPRCFVAKKPWVCVVPFSDTDRLDVYRYRPEGGFAAGTLVASYTRNAQVGVNVTPYTTWTVTTDAFVGATDFEDSTDIRLFPSSQQLRIVAAAAARPVPLAGTATRHVVASHATTFSSAPVAAVNGGAEGGAAYTITTTTSGTNRFVGDLNGASIDTTETIEYALSASNDFRYNYTLGGSVISGGSSQTGSYTIDAMYDKKSLSCVFIDAAYEVSVFLEKTFTVTYAQTHNLNLSRVVRPSSWGGDPPPPNGMPAVATPAYYWQYPREEGFPDPWDFMFGSFDQTITNASSGSTTASYRDLREVVVVREGAEILRHAYWDMTTSGLPSLGTYGGFPTIQPLYIAHLPTTPEILDLWGQRTARGMTMKLVGNIGDDDAAVTCDAKGVYVEVVWSISGTPYRLFVDSTGDNWAAQAGVTTGVLSTASKLFRV